jgi:hypothetical protein
MGERWESDGRAVGERWEGGAGGAGDLFQGIFFMWYLALRPPTDLSMVSLLPLTL